MLAESPRAPSMRILLKTHKAGVPLRPIISDIGSAPHRLAKLLAKPLSSLLGTIGDSHLTNSGDLLNRIRDYDLTGKQLVSFEVTALFTNVPIQDVIDAVTRAPSGAQNLKLPLPKDDSIRLVNL